METAINIGFSCSLLNNTMKKIVLSSEKTEDSRQKAIKDEETAIEELERNFLLHFPKCVKKGKFNIPINSILISFSFSYFIFPISFFLFSYSYFIF